jgi:AcrR family transcriptional regulator
VARPKKVTDEVLVAAAYDILMDLGPTSLTFEKLSEKVGLVPAALVRRFTNKKNLLLEVDRYALARSNARRTASMAEQDSPIEAILAGFITELSFASTLEKFIHGQEFLLMDFAEKDLYQNYKVSFVERHDQVANLLRQAQARGELSYDINPDEFARLLQMILHGAGHIWAMSQEGPIEDYINHYVKLALAPYRQDKE